MTKITDEQIQARRQAESIRAKLKNLGKNVYTRHPSSGMLLLYTQQGFLGRLAASPYAHQFVLKGALSLFARYGQVARPTEDIDLAARGMPNTPEQLLTVLKNICELDLGDGLTFDADSIQVQPINEGLKYPGVGVKVTASLDTSKIVLQIDVSFGNVITPAPVQLAFPALLLGEAVTVNGYPLETVITEKFAALVERGAATTRMKDIYDLWVILRQESFDAAVVRRALQNSFEARGTPVQDIPTVLNAEFAGDEALNRQWAQYLRRTKFEAPSLSDVWVLLQAFYRPLLLAGVNAGQWYPTRQVWE